MNPILIIVIGVLVLALTGCGDPTIVAVREGDMAGCTTSRHGPTAAEVADCRIARAEKEARR